LSFTVRPGIVTGFPGPNGAGRSTTMRMILGLDRPSVFEVTGLTAEQIGDRAAAAGIPCTSSVRNAHPWSRHSWS
jgi:ABC-type multidrug transport system ATPase subunit